MHLECVLRLRWCAKCRLGRSSQLSKVAARLCLARSSKAIRKEPHKAARYCSASFVAIAASSPQVMRPKGIIVT